MELMINYDDLLNGQREMEAYRMQFETAYRRIYNALSELTAHGYVTDDSRALLRKLESYEAEFREAGQIMEEYAEMLEIIRAGFRRTESELAEQAKKIHAN